MLNKSVRSLSQSKQEAFLFLSSLRFDYHWAFLDIALYLRIINCVNRFFINRVLRALDFSTSFNNRVLNC